MTCSEKAWHALWTDFNRLTTDKIRVDRGALSEVLSCHDDIMGSQPEGLLAGVPRDGSKTVEVNRPSLFNFLNYHGAVCNGAADPGDRRLNK